MAYKPYLKHDTQGHFPLCVRVGVGRGGVGWLWLIWETKRQAYKQATDWWKQIVRVLVWGSHIVASLYASVPQEFTTYVSVVVVVVPSLLYQIGRWCFHFSSPVLR